MFSLITTAFFGGMRHYWPMEWLNILVPDSSDGLAIMNVFLHFFHSALIIFLLVGYLWPDTLKLHLYTVICVWFSWIILGYFMETLGYCLLTDWHWRVFVAMNMYGMPNSYIELLYWMFGGSDVDDTLVIVLTAIVFFFVTCASVWQHHKKASAS